MIIGERSLIGRRVEHDFSHLKGTITDVQDNLKGYCYYVKWDKAPGHNDWYRLKVLILEDSV